ncbi:MAG: hypothetical protein K0S71_577 [Clostridia bacterium]|jgi:hypothetical protein|nr:hypothetical protein [Clostridia bacterium]
MGRIKYEICEIDKQTAVDMVKQYHYSDTVPSSTRHFIGFYLGGELVGIVTLGFGTRPLHTIKVLFPDLGTSDYFEIGRMCMTEDMPRNSESQMLSQLIKWLRVNHPNIKILFTWADGMLGKVGYVYQAANFKYAGHIVSEFYMRDGVKLHPRGLKGVLGKHDDPRITVRPTLEEMEQFNIQHIKGKQFKYFYVVDRKYKGVCAAALTEPVPKENDLNWKIKRGRGVWVPCDKPDYRTDAKTGGDLCRAITTITKNTAELRAP